MDPLITVVQQETEGSQSFNITRESRMGESGTYERDMISYFITPVLVVFVIFGFIGNIIILHVVCTVRWFNRAENLMLANLSTTSIAILIATVSLYTQMTQPFNFYGPVYCNFFAGIHSLFLPAESFTMMCISLERTQRVRFPLVRATKASEFKKIGLVWSLALLLDLPRGFLFYKYDPDMASFVKCLNTKQIFGSWIPYVAYMTTYYTLTFLLPSFWLARDWARLLSQLQFLITCQTLPLHCEYRKRQKKLVGHAIIFTSIFIAVKVPTGTHYLLYELPSHLLSQAVIEWVKTWKRFFFTAMMVHGSFYPFVIFCLSRDIRQHLFCSECHRRPQHSIIRY